MNTSISDLSLHPDSAVDLQLHTIHSDGIWMPEQLIDHLLSEQFSLIAITDHDRLDTIANLQQLGMQRGLPIIPAVEMSASWNGGITDVLCFGVSPIAGTLNDLTQNIQDRQRENTKEVYENLQQKGFIFPEYSKELTSILNKTSSQHPRELANLLKRYGYDSPEKPAGKILREAGCTFATNEIAAIVDAAHQNGAVCVVAHPGRNDGYICYDIALLEQLGKEVPIDGIEAYYPLHTPEQTAMYQQYAGKNNLLTSAGSDSHGPEKKPIKYRAEQARNLLEHLEIQVKE